MAKSTWSWLGPEYHSLNGVAPGIINPMHIAQKFEALLEMYRHPDGRRWSGVYRGVSPKHLQSYLDEYVFRYNKRGDERGMFNTFLERIEKASPDPSGPS